MLIARGLHNSYVSEIALARGMYSADYFQGLTRNMIAFFGCVLFNAIEEWQSGTYQTQRIDWARVGSKYRPLSTNIANKHCNRDA
jgi:hypothetical protein